MSLPTHCIGPSIMSHLALSFTRAPPLAGAGHCRSFAARRPGRARCPAHAQAKPELLRIGFQKSASLLALQKSQGTLEKRLAPLGVAVKWVEFPAGPQLLEGLNVGAVDVGFVGEAPPIFAQAAGAKFVYIGNDPAAPEAEAIVVPKDSPIKAVADLKGKKVALNKGSNVHYLLVQARWKRRGLKYSDIQPVFLPPADARAAFETRRGRCLGDLGPVPRRGGKAERRAHPGRRPRRGEQLRLLPGRARLRREVPAGGPGAVRGHRRAGPVAQGQPQAGGGHHRAAAGAGHRGGGAQPARATSSA